MPTNDRKRINAEVVRLKQSSVARVMSIARDAVARGETLARKKPTNFKLSYATEVRVK
jgi:hypothetical protein